MTSTNANLDLSELAGAVLAMIWRDGPVTPYALRKRAQDSRSPHLSTSAGSIYPLILRLAEQNLIAGQPFVQGKREGTAYTITKIGLKHLRAWIAKPATEVASGALVDPIRTRLFMLNALPPKQRPAVITKLRQALENDLAELMQLGKELKSRPAEPTILAAWRGDLLVQRARLQWLREVEQQLA